MNEENRDERPILLCRYKPRGCDHETTDASNLKKHERFSCSFRSDRLKDQNKFACHICSKVLSSPENLKVHVKRLHERKKFVCRFCQRGFGLRHLCINHERKEHYLTCHECPFRCEKLAVSLGITYITYHIIYNKISFRICVFTRHSID